MQLLNDDIRFTADLPAPERQGPLPVSVSTAVSNQQVDTPAMATSSIEAEFDAEERRLQDRLSFFKDVKVKKLAIEDVKTLISNHYVEIKRLDKKLAIVLNDIEIKEVELEDLKVDHAVKQDEWMAKSNHTNYALCTFGAVATLLRAGKEAEIDLETTVKLAEENLMLLKQLAEFKRLYKVVAHLKTNELLPLRARFEEMKISVGEAEKTLGSLNGELNTALQQWKSKWLGATGRGDIQAYDLGIQLGVSQGHTISDSIWSPLALAGAQIRGRKLEWIKNYRTNPKEDAIIEAGHQASHYGMAVADATMYQSFYPGKRTDVETYVQLYGLEPEFVWQHRSVKEFCDVLDWRGGMKEIYSYSYKNAAYEVTRFHTALLPILEVLKGDENVITDDTIRQLFDKHNAEYQQLKGLYEYNLSRHMVHLKSRKQ